MAKYFCKNCNKSKQYHEKDTMHCPEKARSLFPVFSTDKVYEEVVQVFHTPNATLKIQWSGSYNNAEVKEGESTTIVEWRGHDLIDDDGQVMNFGYYMVEGVNFTFTVTCNSTGQVSDVQVNDAGNLYTKVGYGENEAESVSVQDDNGE